MTSTFTDCIATVPPGERGNARVIHDSPDELTRMRASMRGMPLDREKFCRLFVGQTLYMTDAHFERVTNVDFCVAAKGDILIAGLGIGLILASAMRRGTSVTVIEQSPDVIALVAPHFPGVKVVEGDIFTWRPKRGTKFDTIYFDIWPDICGDDIAEAKQLQAAFRKHLRKGGWMRSWTTIANRAVRR